MEDNKVYSQALCFCETEVDVPDNTRGTYTCNVCQSEYFLTTLGDATETIFFAENGMDCRDREVKCIKISNKKYLVFKRKMECNGAY